MKRISKKVAKELCLEVWQYLYDHPEITNKEEIEFRLYSKIADLTNECPLCHLHRDKDWGMDCDKCILAQNDQRCESRCEIPLKDADAYTLWCFGNKRQRKKAAKIIIDIVSKWSIK